MVIWYSKRPVSAFALSRLNLLAEAADSQARRCQVSSLHPPPLPPPHHDCDWSPFSTMKPHCSIVVTLRLLLNSSIHNLWLIDDQTGEVFYELIVSVPVLFENHSGRKIWRAVPPLNLIKRHRWPRLQRRKTCALPAAAPICSWSFLSCRMILGVFFFFFNSWPPSHLVLSDDIDEEMLINSHLC